MHFSLVLSFLLWKKKEPRREGSKKTWRSASDGSPLSLHPHPRSPLPPKTKKKGSMAVIGAFRGEFPAGNAGKTIIVADACT
jgi:hypothetical protein